MAAGHKTGLCSADVCGWDNFLDFHYSVATTGRWRPLSVVIPSIQKLGYKYHLLKTWHPDGRQLTLFSVTPNGITVQLHNMANGSYVPSAPPENGHDGLCSIGPPTCHRSPAAAAAPAARVIYS